MKLKLPSWFKWEPTGYLLMQAMTVALAALTLYWAIFENETRGQMIANSVISGVNFAALFHNWLHRKRDKNALRMIKTMQMQQELLREIQAVKVSEIAREIAEQIGTDVTIQGPDGPIDPKPTRH